MSGHVVSAYVGAPNVRKAPRATLRLTAVAIVLGACVGAAVGWWLGR